MNQTIEPAHKSKSQRIDPKKTRTITANRVRAWKIIADDTHFRNQLINCWILGIPIHGLASCPYGIGYQCRCRISRW
jgi:hypothetical protein